MQRVWQGSPPGPIATLLEESEQFIPDEEREAPLFELLVVDTFGPSIEKVLPTGDIVMVGGMNICICASMVLQPSLLIFATYGAEHSGGILI